MLISTTCTCARVNPPPEVSQDPNRVVAKILVATPRERDAYLVVGICREARISEGIVVVPNLPLRDLSVVCDVDLDHLHLRASKPTAGRRGPCKPYFVAAAPGDAEYGIAGKTKL